MFRLFIAITQCSVLLVFCRRPKKIRRCFDNTPTNFSSAEQNAVQVPTVYTERATLLGRETPLKVHGNLNNRYQEIIKVRE